MYGIWRMGLLNPDDWKAEWIKTSIDFDEYSYPSPMLRKEFVLDKKVENARVYVTSLGLYELQVNGIKAGDYLLTPGFTSFKKRLPYQVYDISPMLQKGKNAVGIILGNGWYRNFRAYPNEAPNLEERERQDLEALMQLEIEYEDGSREIISTDDTWKSSTGPILMTSIYNGESYDARLEMDGWANPDFNDSSWLPVETVSRKKNNLAATVGPPVRRISEIRPVKVIYTPEGDTLLDMGQNMAGWCRLNVNCPEGTTLVLRHGEMLDNQGNFYTENLRTAKQTIQYTCKGGGTVESYEPRFTYQGFRYVAISGYPGEITPDLLTGIVIHNDMERTGYFHCSDSLVNRLYENILWSMKSNSIHVPTDGPQRDERMGWTGDAQFFCPTACFNYLAPGFYAAWLKDVAAEQAPDGFVYATAPKEISFGGIFGWCDAAVILPWTLYRRYGDISVLEDQYGSMKAWVEYQYKQFQEMEDLQWEGIGDWLAWEGDPSQHYSPGQPTDLDILGTAFFYHITDLLQKTSGLTGRKVDEERYLKMAAEIQEEFIFQFITPGNRLSSNTQTAYAIALSFGLIPEQRESAVASRLAANVNHYGHITSGLLGTKEICAVLTRHGYVEEAYRLLFYEEYPSWLNMVKRGATTVWERWDGIRPDGTFQKSQMNSFNHPALGSVGDWLYRYVSGIDLDAEIPGFKAIVIKPYPGGKMKNASASYESLYGKISSEWKIENEKIRLKVDIPVNTTASIYMPSTSDQMMVNGQPSSQPKIEKDQVLNYHFLKIEAGSGTWEFESDFVPQSPESPEKPIDNRMHLFDLDEIQNQQDY